MDVAIATQNLGMVFRTDWGLKKRALKDLTMTVPGNSIFGFVGHNGAGKTTTIKILVGLCRATEGNATILGVPIDKIESRKNIGFLPENPYFYEYLSARESLEFYGGLFGLSLKQCRQRIPALLDSVGLSQAINTRIKEFSKGMKQRLGLAQAMLHDPEVYILDEPMSGLDPVGRREIREKILDLKRQGKTVFFSSHVLTDVEMLCDQMILLAKGETVSVGSLDSLLDRKILYVELVGRNFSKEALAQVQSFGQNVWQQGQTTALRLTTVEDAQRAKSILESHGGVLEALIPHKESLEDYYIRHWQGHQE